LWALLSMTQVVAAQQALDQDSILQQMAAARVPGLAYALVADGEVLAVDGLGSLRRDQAQAVDGDSRFLLGSVGKSLTALAVLQQVESGRLLLDDTLGQHVPAWADKPAGRATIRQLLSHASGWSTLQGNLQQRDLSLDAEALMRRAHRLAALRPAAEPGQRWQYSNANYVLLGHLIEVVSGQGYGDYLAQHVLRPLQMFDTSVVGAEHSADEGRLAAGHRYWFGMRTIDARPLVGAASAPQGGIVTTVADMARFLACLTNGRDDVLSAKGKQQMFEAAGGVANRYGFGWFVDAEQGRAFHAGASPGFESMVMLLPGQHRAAVVLLTAGSGYGFGETIELRQSVLAQLLQLSYTGERRPLGRQLAYVTLLLLPAVALLLAVMTRRSTTRRLLLPSLFGAVLAFTGLLVLLALLPRLFGAPLGTVSLYRPDIGVLLLVNPGAALIWLLAAWRR
jgi:CubicO group peptidase (beta-lactamase class C family)